MFQTTDWGLLYVSFEQAYESYYFLLCRSIKQWRVARSDVLEGIK